MPSIGFLDGFAFETLIAPCDSEEFIRSYWNQAPMLEQRGLPDFYSGLMSIEDVDRVLAHYSRSGTDDRDRSLDIDAALRRLEQGAALVLEAAQHQLPGLARVCRTVQAELGFRCTSSIEVTMPSNKPHPAEPSDAHVFVMQVAGRRDWQVDRAEFPGTFVLETGDLLYLPPGQTFQHRSTGDLSITATLKVSPPRWVDMTGVGSLASDMALPSALSEALPPGWIHRDAAELVSELSRRWRQADDMMTVEAAVEQLIRKEVRAFPIDLNGRLIEVLHPREISGETVFGARRDLLWTIEQSGSVARLISGPFTMDLRDGLTETIAFCLSEPRYTVEHIPGPTDPEECKVLLDALVKAVLVRRISP